MTKLVLISLGLTGLTVGPAAIAGQQFTVSALIQPTQWKVEYRGRPVLVYEFSPQNYKPYVKELFPLKGDNVLRDAPFDHLHHHALMYGIKVNGVNFWEETASSGVQKVVRTDQPDIGSSPDGLPQARLSQELFWLTPDAAFLPNTNAPTLLVEHRLITLTVNEATQEVALRWNSHFRVGNRTNTVVLTGFNYHGLGMRFRQQLDPIAVHFTDEGKPDLAENRQDVSAHPWEAVSFDLADPPVTLALLGHKSNSRGDSRFFSMRTPFAYLSATQGLDAEPLIYHAGQTFELNYLIVLYPELKTARALSERSKRWEKDLR